MLRRFALAFAAFTALTTAGNALAQPATVSAEERPKVGIGVGVFPTDPVLPRTFEVYVPLNVAPQLRLEPSLGIYTSSNDAEDTSDVTIGVGVFYVQRLVSTADMYLGGRVKLNFASVSPTGLPSTSGTDLTIAAALGGECFLAPKFSVGLEGQLGFYSLGKVTAPGGDTTTGFFTNGLTFLRVYF